MSTPKTPGPSRRQAAQKAAASMAEQISDGSDGDSELDGSPFKGPASARKKGALKGRARKAPANAPDAARRKAPQGSKATNATRGSKERSTPTTPRSSLQKRKRSFVDPTRSEDVPSTGLKDLSPLTSPEVSPAKSRKAVSAHSSETSVASAYLTTPRPLSSLFNSQSSVLNAYFLTSPSGKGKEKTPAKNACKVKETDKYAFVRLNMDGDISSEGAGLWWPAELDRARSDPSIISRVSLQGSPPGPLRGLIPLPSQTDDVIRPLRTPTGAVTFTTSTFRLPPRHTLASPHKKPKTEAKESTMVARWQRAMDELRSLDNSQTVETDTSDDELELPSRILVPELPSSQTSDPLSARSSLANPPPRQYTPELDLEVELDDGPVLAKHGKSKMCWPAKVTGFDYTTGKYCVHYFDGIVENLPRESFFIPGSEDFNTCNMGEIGSEEPLDDHISEHDEDQHHAEIIRLRAALEAPPKGEAPHQMQHMSDQLPYIVPIMQAILAGTYKPARSAHDDFMAGGSRRDALLRSRCAYGDLTQRQKHALERVLKAWVFGDEDFHYLASQRRSEWDTGSDDPFATVSPPQNDASLLSETKNGAKAPPPSSSPDDDSVTVVPHDTSKFRSRLHGCEDYESLSELERHEYCTSVLKPEACYQLLLWHRSKRTSIEMQSDEEEERLHAEAILLAAQPDLVVQVRDLRRLYSGGRLAGMGRDDVPVITFTNSGRARRNAVKSRLLR